MFAYNSASGSTVFVFSGKAIPTDKYIEVPSDFMRKDGYQYHIDWQTKTLVGELIPVMPEPVDQMKLIKEQLEAETQRADFLEDCVAEMAAKVYAT